MYWVQKGALSFLAPLSHNSHIKILDSTRSNIAVSLVKTSKINSFTYLRNVETDHCYR